MPFFEAETSLKSQNPAWGAVFWPQNKTHLRACVRGSSAGRVWGKVSIWG